MYREDTVTKTNDGGLNNIKKECKVVWVYLSDNVTHCPVKLVDKYVSLCSQITVKSKRNNFYMRSLDRVNPAQWFGEQVVGKNTLRKVVSNLLKSANLDGHFTNHSLRRTSATRLFQAGIDRKLIKEFTGHTSDVIDKYQITSNIQRSDMSKVLQQDKLPTISVENDPPEEFDKIEPPKESLQISIKDVW